MTTLSKIKICTSCISHQSSLSLLPLCSRWGWTICYWESRMLVQSAKRHEEMRHVQCLTVPLSLLAAAWIFFRPPSRALRRIPDKLLCLSRCCATISANWERQTGDSKRLWHHRIIAFIKVSQFCDHTQTHRTATARKWHCSTSVSRQQREFHFQDKTHLILTIESGLFVIYGEEQHMAKFQIWNKYNVHT